MRPGRAGDLPGINAIYNHYVTHSPATFEIEPVTAAAREEWAQHYADTGRYRLLVVADDERVFRSRQNATPLHGMLKNINAPSFRRDRPSPSRLPPARRSPRTRHARPRPP